MPKTDEIVLRIREPYSPLHTHTLGHRVIQFKSGIAVVKNADSHLIEEIKKREGQMWDIVEGKTKEATPTKEETVKLRKLEDAQKQAEKDKKVADDRKKLKDKKETEVDPDSRKAKIEALTNEMTKKEMVEMLKRIKNNNDNVEYDERANKTVLAGIIVDNANL